MSAAGGLVVVTMLPFTALVRSRFRRYCLFDAADRGQHIDSGQTVIRTNVEGVCELYRARRTVGRTFLLKPSASAPALFRLR